MTKDEALKLALETLEYAGPSWIDARQPAITAIKEALAQPEQDWKIHPKEDAPLVKWAKEQTPPQRTWVGLTDIDYAGLPLEQVGLVRWAEAKLKEKNT